MREIVITGKLAVLNGKNVYIFNKENDNKWCKVRYPKRAMSHVLLNVGSGEKQNDFKRTIT